MTVIHDRLRSAILRGEIEAGTRTSQPALAREYDAGRTPLREALRLLQREGLVVSEPNRRLRIAELSAADAEQLYIMRVTLEAAAIRLTVPRLTSRNIAELDGLFAQMDHYQKTNDRAGLREPHHAFHQLLVSGVGPRVDAELSQLFDHAERYRLAYGAADPVTWDHRRAEHRGILDAVGDGDAELAATRLVGHYLQTAQLIFSGLDPTHTPDRLLETVRTVTPALEISAPAVA